MLSHRLRIIASLTIAFFITILYDRLSTKNLLSNLKLPNLANFITFKLSTFPVSQNSPNTQSNFFNLPTTKPIPTDSTDSNRFQPTLTKVPTVAAGQPTYTPVPTKKPKPTSKPKPSITPPPQPITSDTRPGSSLEEIFQEVNKRICVPVALLRAFQEKESGAWVKYSSFNPIPYNTYGWWTDPAGPDPCKGIGYDETTGYTFSDMAIQKKCTNPLTTNPGQTGIFSISQWEQDVTRKNTVKFLPNSIDRRVIFDAALIFASATINRVWNQAPDCGQDWSNTAVGIAAAKHVSGQYPCINAICEKYSSDILSLYKKYR